jgi:hypothetical protein
VLEVGGFVIIRISSRVKKKRLCQFISKQREIEGMERDCSRERGGARSCARRFAGIHDRHLAFSHSLLSEAIEGIGLGLCVQVKEQMAKFLGFEALGKEWHDDCFVPVP